MTQDGSPAAIASRRQARGFAPPAFARFTLSLALVVYHYNL